MIVHFKDGNWMARTFAPINATGYSKVLDIAMDRRDFRNLREIISRNPSDAIRMLQQLEERFNE